MVIIQTVDFDRTFQTFGIWTVKCIRIEGVQIFLYVFLGLKLSILTLFNLMIDDLHDLLAFDFILDLFETMIADGIFVRNSLGYNPTAFRITDFLFDVFNTIFKFDIVVNFVFLDV